MMLSLCIIGCICRQTQGELFNNTKSTASEPTVSELEAQEESQEESTVSELEVQEKSQEEPTVSELEVQEKSQEEPTVSELEAQEESQEESTVSELEVQEKSQEEPTVSELEVQEESHGKLSDQFSAQVWDYSTPQVGDAIVPQPGDTTETWNLARAGEYPDDADCSATELLEKWMVFEARVLQIRAEDGTAGSANRSFLKIYRRPSETRLSSQIQSRKTNAFAESFCQRTRLQKGLPEYLGLPTVVQQPFDSHSSVSRNALTLSRDSRLWSSTAIRK